jgi:uncharacterized membrane protein
MTPLQKVASRACLHALRTVRISTKRIRTELLLFIMLLELVTLTLCVGFSSMVAKSIAGTEVSHSVINIMLELSFKRENNARIVG